MTTTASTSHTTPKQSRREQFVAASLVGAVVVLLGFASGLGVDPVRSDARSGLPASNGAHPSTNAATGPTTPSPTVRPPVNYIGVALPGGGSAPSSGPSTPPASSPGASQSHGQPQPSRASTAPGSTRISCPPDLLSSLLGSLTGASSPGAGVLSPIGGLVNMLTGVLGLGLPPMTLSSLLGEVTQLLSGLPALPGISTHPASPSLASACTTALSNILPMTGGGR